MQVNNASYGSSFNQQGTLRHPQYTSQRSWRIRGIRNVRGKGFASQSAGQSQSLSYQRTAADGLWSQQSAAENNMWYIRKKQAALRTVRGASSWKKFAGPGHGLQGQPVQIGRGQIFFAKAVSVGLNLKRKPLQRGVDGATTSTMSFDFEQPNLPLRSRPWRARPDGMNTPHA